MKNVNCRNVQKLISLSIDGKLAQGELLKLEAHLGECAACADLVECTREAVAALADLPVVAAADDGWEQLRGRLESQKSGLRAPVWRRALVPAGAVAVAAGIAALAWWGTPASKVADNRGGGAVEQGQSVPHQGLTAEPEAAEEVVAGAPEASAEEEVRPTDAEVRPTPQPARRRAAVETARAPQPSMPAPERDRPTVRPPEPGDAAVALPPEPEEFALAELEPDPEYTSDLDVGRLDDDAESPMALVSAGLQPLVVAAESWDFEASADPVDELVSFSMEDWL